jgi:hypothetical protein
MGSMLNASSLHHSNRPLGFTGARNIRLNPAEVIKTQPNSAKDSPYPPVMSKRKPKNGGPAAASTCEISNPIPRILPSECRPK